MYQRKDKKLAELQFAEKTMNTIRTQGKMTDVDRLKFLKNRQQTHRQCYEQDEDQEELTYDLSFIAMCKVENEVELGTLLHKKKWECTSKVESCC